VRSAAITDPGRLHKSNEDAWFADDARGLWMVADGVGSYRGSGKAAAWVVESVAQALTPPAPDGAYELRAWIARTIKAASDRLKVEVAKDPRLLSMCSTLTMLTAAGGRHIFAQIGDSRGYRLRARRLEQMTSDHSVAFEQFKAGAITKEQLRTHPNQRMLTRTLSPDGEPPAEIVIAVTEPGDRFLLCSDGLTKELDDAEIEAILNAEGDPPAHARRLVDAANGRGGGDNITVIVVAP
jgi:protein phosphatase